MSKDSKKTHWELIISIVLVISTILGVTLPIVYQSKSEIAAQNARTDKLYEMFIELIKEQKK